MAVLRDVKGYYYDYVLGHKCMYQQHVKSSIVPRYDT